ncbi:MAG: hypothetical protein D6753_05700 [Planctomycetota bacterium]|nr:MAG: hypothetical protein D6753_05700 [Planctomycetota bacterium]
MVVLASTNGVGGLSPSFAQQTVHRTALDEYVHRPDDAYRWQVVSEKTVPGGRHYVLELVSQRWLTPADVNRTEWKHWLLMVVPENRQTDIGLLWIGSGSNRNEAPSGPDSRLQAIAKATQTVVAEIKMVPNQPLVFHGDGEERYEDDLIAYTWDQFLKTGDSRWPARNAMIKSAVRAMDVVSEVTEQDQGSPQVQRFVVAGASKRGWTTWLTGAIDSRVIAIAPIVIDVLNVDPNIRHHFAAYGFWAPSVGDYVEHGITQRLDAPRMPELIRLVDPYFYRDRLHKPKLVLNASGDQFFPPDSSHYYYNELPGTKHVRYVANADHGLKDTNALDSLIAWYWAIVHDRPLPVVTWQVDSDDRLIVRTVMEPSAVRLWHAHNPQARDFRLEAIGKAYQSRELDAAKEMAVPLQQPDQGWAANFVELEYDIGAPVRLVLSTEVFILPDVLPYADKRPDLPPSITIRCHMAAAVASEMADQPIPPQVAERVDDVQISSRSVGTDRAVVQINWVPKGRFEPSAEAVAAWLTALGAADFDYRLESGRPEPLGP